MKFKAGQTVWCSLVSQEVLIINPALNENEYSDIELWCIEFKTGQRMDISVNHLSNLEGARKSEKNKTKSNREIKITGHCGYAYKTKRSSAYHSCRHGDNGQVCASGRCPLDTNHIDSSRDEPADNGNPWRKFSHDGDDPPEQLHFGFSRFVIGKDKDGKKFPVIFDHQNANWHTPGFIEATEGDQGDAWEEVQIIEWREL